MQAVVILLICLLPVQGGKTKKPTSAPTRSSLDKKKPSRLLDKLPWLFLAPELRAPCHFWWSKGVAVTTFSLLASLKGGTCSGFGLRNVAGGETSPALLLLCTRRVPEWNILSILARKATSSL